MGALYYIKSVMPSSASPIVLATTARTWLFVPGDRPERFAKAATSGAGAVVLDLEDAVVPDHKDAARAHVADWFPAATTPVAVRINGTDTSWHRADLTALASIGPVTVMLPKAEDPGAVAAIAASLPTGSAIVALIETSQGVINAPAIAKVPGVQRLALGTFDLAAELGVDPDHGPAMAGARGALVLASAAASLPGPIDGVTGSVRNQEQLVADVTASAAIGFAGKLCIHPTQVGPAAAALAPTAEEVSWANRILAAVAAADHGVVVVDGRMVDAPVISRAQRIAAAAS